MNILAPLADRNRTAARLILRMTLMLAVSAAALPALAQIDWKPAHAVEWLVPAGAGSQLDAIVRLGQSVLQQKQLVSVPIVPVNKGGASQSIAIGLLLNRNPGDGQALAVMSATLLSAHILGTHKLDFNAATPLAYLGAEYYVFAVKGDSKIASGTDLIERLRRDPRAITIGTSNLGGVGHIQMLAVLKAAGIDTQKLVVVGFKGGSQARAALLGGDIDMNSTSGSNMVAEVSSGRVRVIAVNAPQRLPGIYASVPTWKELGVNSPVLSGWAAVLGPRAMTEAQIAFWDRAFAQMIKSPEWIADAERRYRSLDYRDSAGTRAFIADEYKTLQAIIPSVGIVQR